MIQVSRQTIYASSPESVGGIGEATALDCSVNGMHVMSLDVNVDEGKNRAKMAKAPSTNMTFLNTDLTDDNQIVEAVRKASDLGQVKYLAHIAGIQHVDSVENFPMESDLLETCHQSTDIFSTMNKRVYNITKFGLRALSQSRSAKGSGKIRSFGVSVGFFKTGLALEKIPSLAA